MWAEPKFLYSYRRAKSVSGRVWCFFLLVTMNIFKVIYHRSRRVHVNQKIKQQRPLLQKAAM